LRLQFQIGVKGLTETLELPRLKLDDEVNVARRTRYAMKIRREGADNHLRNADRFECREHCDDGFVCGHQRSTE
jgi:hypothetical protein